MRARGPAPPPSKSRSVRRANRAPGVASKRTLTTGRAPGASRRPAVRTTCIVLRRGRPLRARVVGAGRGAAGTGAAGAAGAAAGAAGAGAAAGAVGAAGAAATTKRRTAAGSEGELALPARSTPSTRTSWAPRRTGVIDQPGLHGSGAAPSRLQLNATPFSPAENSSGIATPGRCSPSRRESIVTDGAVRSTMKVRRTERPGVDPGAGSSARTSKAWTPSDSAS